MQRNVNDQNWDRQVSHNYFSLAQNFSVHCSEFSYLDLRRRSMNLYIEYLSWFYHATALCNDTHTTTTTQQQVTTTMLATTTITSWTTTTLTHTHKNWARIVFFYLMKSGSKLEFWFSWLSPQQQPKHVTTTTSWTSLTHTKRRRE